MKYVPNTQLPMMDMGLPDEEQAVQEKKMENGGA